ncbi:MAG TPA: DUF3224 domain-containing protein [Thermomicrobiales bacterium]|nr:DUF3224 domain-containing protein [Thermomicrobiales bacterium]
MPTTATAEFTIISWEPVPNDEDVPGPRIVRTVVKKTFTGALTGASVAELLTCESESGSAGYVAMERVEGTLDGLDGTFVLQHGGIFDAVTGKATPYGAVVPGSGAGELSGLRGSAEYKHDESGALLTLHYDLER